MYFPIPKLLFLKAALMIGAAPGIVAEVQSITPEQLATEWSFHGLGSAASQNRMFYMEESPGSQGVMVVSPEAFEGDVIVRFEIMPMNAASVCVVVLHASDAGESTSLTLPEGYDGSMGHWINRVDNYFFAFHNAAHDRTPFGVRFPGGTPIGQAEVNVIRSGEFTTIEISRLGGEIAFSANGEVLFSGKDEHLLPSGHLSIRLRGIPQITAAALIRNLTVEQR
jgi:hypothetical protein